jgi:hypothetical protein
MVVAEDIREVINKDFLMLCPNYLEYSDMLKKQTSSNDLEE